MEVTRVNTLSPAACVCVWNLSPISDWSCDQINISCGHALCFTAFKSCDDCYGNHHQVNNTVNLLGSDPHITSDVMTFNIVPRPSPCCHRVRGGAHLHRCWAWRYRSVASDIQHQCVSCVLASPGLRITDHKTQTPAKVWYRQMCHMTAHTAAREEEEACSLKSGPNNTQEVTSQPLLLWKYFPLCELVYERRPCEPWSLCWSLFVGSQEFVARLFGLQIQLQGCNSARHSEESACFSWWIFFILFTLL